MGFLPQSGIRSRLGVREDEQNSVRRRLCSSHEQQKQICKFWQQGKCHRGPACRYLHPVQAEKTEAKHSQANGLTTHEPQAKKRSAASMIIDHINPKKEMQSTQSEATKLSNRTVVAQSTPPESTKLSVVEQNTQTEATKLSKNLVWTRNDDGAAKKNKMDNTQQKPSIQTKSGKENEPEKEQVYTQTPISTTKKPCKYFLEGSSCRFGEKCRFLHSHSTVTGLELVTTLTGHEKSIKGVALGSHLLFTGSYDQSLRAWDCNKGTCKDASKFGDSVEAVATGFGWVFAALGNHVRAWDINTGAYHQLQTGQEVSIGVLCVGQDMVMAGTKQGAIFGWSFCKERQAFSSPATWRGHTGAVLSLTLSAGSRMYSGSEDKSIRVWDIAVQKCLQVLEGHTQGVTGVLCWGPCLISCSLDGYMKVWVATSSETTHIVNEYTYPEDESHAGAYLGGALGICGTLDAQRRPMVGCVYRDRSVRMYDLPSFEERGALYFKEEITTLSSATESRLVFTGDSEGAVKVWHWI